MCIMDIKIKQNPYFLKQGFCQVTIFFVTLHYISQIIVAKLHFFAKYTNLFFCVWLWFMVGWEREEDDLL